MCQRERLRAFESGHAPDDGAGHRARIQQARFVDEERAAQGGEEIRHVAVGAQADRCAGCAHLRRRRDPAAYFAIRERHGRDPDAAPSDDLHFLRG